MFSINPEPTDFALILLYCSGDGYGGGGHGGGYGGGSTGHGSACIGTRRTLPHSCSTAPVFSKLSYEAALEDIFF